MLAGWRDGFLSRPPARDRNHLCCVFLGCGCSIVFADLALGRGKVYVLGEGGRWRGERGRGGGEDWGKPFVLQTARTVFGDKPSLNSCHIIAVVKGLTFRNAVFA